MSECCYSSQVRTSSVALYVYRTTVSRSLLEAMLYPFLVGLRIIKCCCSAHSSVDGCELCLKAVHAGRGVAIRHPHRGVLRGRLLVGCEGGEGGEGGRGVVGT